MRKRLVDRIPFTKIVTVLAIAFGVSLGLCGLTFVVSSGSHAGPNFFMTLGLIELAAMILSAAGLVLTFIVWIVLAIATSFGE
jgi:hypothetical protein